MPTSSSRRRKAAGCRMRPTKARVSSRGFFVLSAETKPALAAMAASYAERIAHLSDQDTGVVSNAVAHRRERMAHRHRHRFVPQRRDMCTTALNAYVAGSEAPQMTSGDGGRARPADRLRLFGQRQPMGRHGYCRLSQQRGVPIALRRGRRPVPADRGLVAHRCAVQRQALKETLPTTKIAQPLIFAVQSAATVAMAARGLRPSVVLGHSVGEVAAAEAAGIFDLRTAVEVIYFAQQRGRRRPAAPAG